MRCPYCKGEVKVIDSRESPNGEVRRRRKCGGCEKRFTTYEQLILDDLTVLKKDGRKEKFDAEKIKKGLRLATEKRNVSEADIIKIAETIESKLRQKKTEVKSKQIGEMIMKQLRRVDEVAYLRFASVCKDFDCAEKFKEEIEVIACRPKCMSLKKA